MRVDAADIEGIILEDFDAFFRSTFAGVARAAALVAHDPGTGQELAQEVFFRLYERRDSMRNEQLDLAAGSYVLICNIHDKAEKEAHYQQGMRVEFTVE